MGAAAAVAAEQAAHVREATTEAESMEEKVDLASQRVQEVCTSVATMFEKLGCRTEAVRALLPDDMPTDKTLLQYVGVIEQRANEILQQYLALATDDRKVAVDRVVKALTAATGIAPNAVPLEFTIDPPSTAQPATEEIGPRGPNRKTKQAEKGPHSGVDDENVLDRPMDTAELKGWSLKAAAAAVETAVKVKVQEGADD